MCFIFLFYTCLGEFFFLLHLPGYFFLFLFYFTALHPACTCISTQQLVRMFIGGDWDKSCSSGIWDGKNADSTIGNEMVNEWTDSGKWDRRKAGTGWEASGQIVGREMGREQFIVRWDGKRGNRNQ